MLHVIDAGIAVKWFIPEADSPAARQLLERYNQGIDDFVAPDLIVSEVANVLWKRCRQGDINMEEASTSLDDFLSLRIALVPSTELVKDAFDLAVKYNQTVYDALYLALSLTKGCHLITVDERLFHAVSPAFPKVTLLQDWLSSAP